MTIGVDGTGPGRPINRSGVPISLLEAKPPRTQHQPAKDARRLFAVLIGAITSPPVGGRDAMPAQYRQGNVVGFDNGSGAEGTRTPDPLHAMEVRYQLRHSPASNSLQG